MRALMWIPERYTETEYVFRHRRTGQESRMARFPLSGHSPSAGSGEFSKREAFALSRAAGASLSCQAFTGQLKE